MNVTRETKPCSKCGQPQDRKGQRYCRACHTAYVRDRRPKYSTLSPEEIYRRTARSKAGIYQGRGKLVKQPCAVCGSTANIERHHEDYAKPLEGGLAMSRASQGIAPD